MSESTRPGYPGQPDRPWPPPGWKPRQDNRGFVKSEYERPAIRLLKRAGWEPGRSVGIADDLGALEMAGYEVFPGAIAFLREYSGLFLAISRPGEQDAVCFSVRLACRQTDRGRVEVHSELAGVRMVPIGLVQVDQMTVLLGEDGQFYGGYVYTFGKLGTSLLEFIENTVQGKGFLTEP
ncbi:SUKH-3 domain-containing protein [Amycolatopsis sp. cg5]|uniref:SUKH-3 domain-containing protein n=1 Tax=Amycolatopsis sp. cg5 TaxID=3238802 RepID=UPI0035237EE0